MPAIPVPEVLGELIGAQQVRVEAHDADRLVELRALGQRAGGADLGDGELTQLVGVLDERPVQLVEAANAQLDIGGPVGAVERATRRRDRRFGLLGAGVRRVPDDSARRGIDRSERLAGGDEAAVDQQAAVCA